MMRRWFARSLLAGASVMLFTLGLPDVATAQPVIEESRPAVVRAGTWYIADSVNDRFLDAVFLYGNATDQPLFCNFNGGAPGTGPVVVRDGVWYYDSNRDNTADVVFAFGNPGDIPLCADFNGDGKDQPIVVRDGVWYWEDDISHGVADHVINYGAPGDHPITGAWAPSGGPPFQEGPGVLRGNTWLLRDTATPGFADHVFGYGNGIANGDLPIVGDWNADGADTVGVVRNGTWILTDSADASTVDHVFGYGDPGDIPLTWDNPDMPAAAAPTVQGTNHYGR